MSDETWRHLPSGDAHWESLARYLAGESPEAEAAAVRQWLADHATEAETIAALDAAMHRLKLEPAAGVDVEAALRRVRSRLREPEVRRLPRPMALRGGAGSQVRPMTWRIVMLAAAAVIMFVIAGQIRHAARPTPAAPAVAAARTFVTPVGRRDSLLLPDGSHVVLGPGSRLTLQDGFGAGARPVTLQGEAYFDVIHDSLHPFSVHTDLVTISDVGTSFGVHGDSDAVRVSVTSGAVRLTSPSATTAITLGAGDAALATEAGFTARRGGASPEDLAWTQGRLVFRDASLPDVAADLHRWYGITLRVADSALAGRHVTASFAGDPAQHVVKVIALTLGAEVEWHGDTALVTAGRGAHTGGGSRIR